MTKERLGSDLPPFVAVNPETGDQQIKLKDLPDAIKKAILADNSLDEGPREWYNLRQGVMALRVIGFEVEAGSELARIQLDRDWLKDMPEEWEEYVRPYLGQERKIG
jgi:hypothetical protein